jgi:two-component system, LuxR family, response regulator FixJ
MNHKPIVHVVDDEAAMRGSLKMLLQTEGYDVRVYPLAQAFLDGIASAEGGCVITDVRMPDMTGVEMLKKLREMHSSFPVVVITAFADVPLAVEAMKSGAVDFIEKPFSDQILFEAVQAALAPAGDVVIQGANLQEVSERFARLSRREMDVLTGLLNGRLNKMIAFDLGISVRTVETHRANLMEKMQADSLSQLIRMGMQMTGKTGTSGMQ